MGTERGHDNQQRREGERGVKAEREKGGRRKLAKSLIPRQQRVACWRKKGMRTAAATAAKTLSVHPSVCPWLRALSRLVVSCRKYQETRPVAGLLYSFWATSKYPFYRSGKNRSSSSSHCRATGSLLF